MILKIRVAPLKDNGDITFAKIVLYHDTCLDQMEKHRSILSGNHTLKCTCGLEVELPVEGQSHQAIVRIAIGSEPGRVEANQVSCNREIEYMALLVA